MSLTSLVINSSHTPPATEYHWESMSKVLPNFTRGIQTQSLGDEDSDDLSTLGSVISGMPTVFARCNMFRLSFENVRDKNQSNQGLLAFYQSLIGEWRGLISCIALNPDKIQVRRINLAYSGGQNISSVDGLKIYEPAGSFGNMLFERKPLWSDPKVDNPNPFLDVIIYNKDDGTKVVIGGTNPDSLFFTSANYNMAGEKSAYVNVIPSDNKDVGKFVDPIKSKDFDIPSLKKVYSYVNHIISKMNDFTRFFSDHIVDGKPIIEPSYHGDIISNLKSWKAEMEAYLKEKDIPPFEDDEIPQISHFQAPYSIFGNYSTSISALDGVIFDSGVEGGVTFNPNELLLPDTVKIACVDDDGNANFLKDKPVLLLKAEDTGNGVQQGEFRHFLLPLSPKGIQVFGKNLGAVLGINKNNTAVKSRITGEYNIDDGILKVSVKLFTETKKLADFNSNYKTTNDDIVGKDLLVWPNFISPKWNKYYLFSEMPHNSPSWSAVPFCVDNKSERQEMIMSATDPLMPELLAANGKETDVNKAKLIIDCDRTKLGGNPYEYEIYESVNPFKGFQVMHQNSLVGYAVIEYGTDPKSPIHVGNLRGDLKPAHLGVDFGSTNSAIAYREGDGKAVGFQFKNRRVSLFAPHGDGPDGKNNNVKPAGEDEVFFFQNDEIQSNQIKSVLSLHDKNRMKDDKGQNNLVTLSSEEVKGGFPCFEKNLPIEDSTDNTYLLKFRSIGHSTLIHSMKWSDDASTKEMDKANRKAYLKSLLLQVYSDLFEKGLYASSLKWAYPSAMGDNDILVYNSIWKELEGVNPLSAGHELIVKEGRANSDGFGDADGGTGDWGGPSAADSSDGGWGVDSSAADSSTGGWGSSDDSGGSWGDTPAAQQQPAQSGGWGEEEKPKVPKKELKIDNGPISFDFDTAPSDMAMTESCAVANFLVNQPEFKIDPGDLTLCFDIGGSTTDILVLSKMKKTPDGDSEIAMVKQSSIRFAAQRVAQATKYSPNFKKVLINFLDRKKIKVEGINNGGANKFNENTAPYYFEQLVDRLEDSDFDDFYRELGTECKEMVSVNLYVTGLIVFYAGQIARKVKMEIDQSPNKDPFWSNKANINIQFTGKGSRIMDWLKAINPDYDKKYYMDMFMNGFGGIDEAKKHLFGPNSIRFHSRDNSINVKFEVAKGLASDPRTLLIPKTGQKPLEIFGEDGFVLSSGGEIHQLTSNDSITPEMINEIGNRLISRPQNPNVPCPRFMQFASLYFQVSTKFFGLKATQQDFMGGFQNMNISNYITLLPEFKEAKRANEFDFVAPIIILEGMQFFENVVLKKLSNR